MSAVGLLAATAMLSVPALPALAAGPGGGGSSGGGGGSGGGGSGTGSVYADLTINLRAANGSPILKKYVVPPTSESSSPTTEYCQQPVSYSPIPGVASTINPVDGRTVWTIPLQGEWITSPPDPLPVEAISACDPQPQYAMFVSEVVMERLNQARSTDDFLATKLAAVTAKLMQGSSISLESTGRISIDGVPIDAPPENAAIYQSLMNTGTVPGLPASMAGPPAVIGPEPPGPNSNSQFNAWELAAMTIGAAASKDVPVNVDTVEYYNRIMGFPPAADSSGSPYSSPWGVKFVRSTDPDTGNPMTAGEQFVDYSGFSYNRSETFKGSVTWLDVPTLTWKVSKITDVVPFTNLSDLPQIGDNTLHGIVAFAQLADDVRALCNFIPDNTYIPGFYMDVPGFDTTAAQERTIVNPAVDLGPLPTNVFESYPFPMTSSLLNPFAGSLIDNARLRVTVHAPQTLTAADVTAVAGDGQAVPFSANGTDLTGWWGPDSGFPVAPGYNVSTNFTVTVADGAPTGAYTITLDLVRADDPAQVLAADTSTIQVLPNQTTLLWGQKPPVLATQGVPMTLPLQVYSPAAGNGQLALTVTGPTGGTALKGSDMSIYASDGNNMVAMPLTPNSQGQLVGTWNVAISPGFTPVDWYATVAEGAPIGGYTFDISLQGANTLDPVTVSVAAPETHGQKPPGSGEDTTPPVVTVTPVGTLGSTASFNLTANESGVRFACQLYLNGLADPAQACTSPVTYSGLQPGVYVFSVVGTDRAGNVSDAVTQTWTVGPSSSGIEITSAAATVFKESQAGTFTVTAIGNPAPLFTTVGNLPAGVSFTDNGDGTATLAGTPTAGTKGSYPVTVIAWYGADAAVQQFDLTVEAAPGTAPAISSSAKASLVVGQAGAFTVTATGSPTPQIDIKGTLPRGVTFTDKGDSTAVLSGTPAAGTVGVYPLTFTAANGVSPDAVQQFTLTVTPAQSPGNQGLEPEGYWLVGKGGTVYTFGPRINSYGSITGVTLSKPIVGMATIPGGRGYWLVAADGGVFSFGNARFYGSTGGTPLNQPVVGMAATPSGHGYWLVAADGGVFSFGDARFYGSTGGTPLNQPVVGMAATPSGHGYWLVAADGGVFSFGDARFYGSTGGMVLNKPIVGMATPDAKGYWLVASDGGIFAFGDAPFYGSTGAMTLNQPIVGMDHNPATGGYWLIASDGGIFSYHTPFYGSTADTALGQPIVTMASAA
jgi:Putative Ig domain